MTSYVDQDHGNTDATLWIGNLDSQASEELLWELMVQAGPVGKQCWRERLDMG